MELRHLRYFIAVAETLSFSRAAEQLHIAQPPLSQQIRQLETELGFTLFQRTKRRVQLTEAGQVFLEWAYKILQQLEQAIATGQQVSRGEAGHLVIGFVSSAAYSVLPSLLRDFRQAYPLVTLELREMASDQQIRALLAGELDLGLVRPPISEPELQTTTLLQESLIVVLPESHPLAQQECVEMRSLADEPFILFPRLSAMELYDAVISLCQQANFSPNVVQEAVQTQTMISFVAAEMGVTILPASLQNLQRRGVVYKPLIEPTPLVAIALAWRQPAAATVQTFLNIAQPQADSGNKALSRLCKKQESFIFKEE